jgi:hypothetical protein
MHVHSAGIPQVPSGAQYVTLQLLDGIAPLTVAAPVASNKRPENSRRREQQPIADAVHERTTDVD